MPKCERECDYAALAQVDKDLFDKVWAIVTECGERESQFNTLQTAYRSLACTILLGIVAAVGFLFSDHIRVEYRFPLAALVGFAGGIALWLLWTLDILVYQQLLGAVFEEGRLLEGKFCFLPSLRERMKSYTGGGGIRSTVLYFYLVSSMAAMLLSSACVLFSKSPIFPWPQMVGAIIAIVGVGGCLRLRWVSIRNADPGESESHEREANTQSAAAGRN